MINLTAPFTQTGAGIGYPNTTDNAVKASLPSYDLDSKTITIQVRGGSNVGGVFVPDPHLGIVATIIVYLNANPVQCQVTNSTGLNEEFNLTLSAQLTPVNTMFNSEVAAQAVIEAFLAVSGGLFPGTVVAG